ncbi:MAG: hypothetical protein AAFQ02_04860 [Bacteroidota bacterium]
MYQEFISLQKFFIAVSALLCLVTSHVNGQSYDTDFVRYLNSDGVTYKDYTRVESRRPSNAHHIKKGSTPESEYSFIAPNQYKLVPMLDKDYNMIQFPQGSFSLIKDDTLRTKELRIEDGLYTWQNDYETNVDGYFGCYAVPDGFRHFNYVWVFPDNLEIVAYESNRDGEWRIEGNTLSFIAHEVNNVLFKIQYRSLLDQPMKISGRDVVLKDSIQVGAKAITISIWDDSKIDSDVISIKINDEWIVKYLEAKQEKTTFKYFLTKPENFIILRADNIGEIPPNTTAVQIDDGKNSKMIVLNSDLGMSEAIKVNLVEG